jgi:Cytochrome c7 and related cytochrome c
MAQVFHRSTNTLSKVSIFGAIFVAGFALWVLLGINRSPYVTRAGEMRDQPVPFSHQHHVGGIGIDCRYCHTSVEVSASAGLPPTKTCMNCHSQIWNQSPMLEPVRASFRSGESLEWTRVHDLPDFVYFNHSAHVNRGMACVVCHGRVDRMPLMTQENSLQMEWCLECHRHPERYVRPVEHVFDPAWTWEQGHSQAEDGPRLAKEYKLKPRTSCSTCHR